MYVYWTIKLLFFIYFSYNKNNAFFIQILLSTYINLCTLLFHKFFLELVLLLMTHPIKLWIIALTQTAIITLYSYFSLILCLITLYKSLVVQNKYDHCKFYRVTLLITIITYFYNSSCSVCYLIRSTWSIFPSNTLIVLRVQHGDRILMFNCNFYCAVHCT